MISLFTHITAAVSAMLMMYLPALNAAQHLATAYEATYQNLGSPLSDYYETGVPARSIWEMKWYNDKLFIACGDYDTNAGPVPMMHYDILNETWVDSGTVEDEQINQFYVFGDSLLAPGLDPRADWSYGNIYAYTDNQWQTLRTIPNGIHQFDIISYNDRLFVATGTVAGHFPVQVSDDNGASFNEVPMYKDGTLLNTAQLEDHADAQPIQIRCYDFFKLDGNLYLFYCGYFDLGWQMEIYRYVDGAFQYYSQLPTQLHYKRINYNIFNAKAEYQNAVYFSTGNLYRTTDMIHAQEISLPENTIVTDIKQISDRLYITTSIVQEDGTYRNSVWINHENEPDCFHELFFFTFPCPAQCFEYRKGSFYFGMGEGTLSEGNDFNGTVLSVSYPIK